MKDLQTFFTTLNIFFDKIYVITLERATDRHEHVKKELQGLQYEIFYGKDKQSFTIPELKQDGIYSEALAKQHHRYSKPMQEGQIGCAWSHAEVYKDIIANNYQRALILEDDIVIDKKEVKHFGRIISQLPKDWELLYFGYAERETHPSGLFIKRTFYHLLRLLGAIKFSHTTINHLYPKQVADYIYQAGYHDCTHAYAVTQSAAEKLLSLQKPISFIADNLLAHAVTNKIVKGYIMKPKLIDQQYQVGITSVSYLNQ